MCMIELLAELVPIIVPKKRGRPVIVKTNQSYSVSVIKALLKGSILKLN